MAIEPILQENIMTKAQKRVCFTASIICILVFGIVILPASSKDDFKSNLTARPETATKMIVYGDIEMTIDNKAISLMTWTLKATDGVEFYMRLVKFKKNSSNVLEFNPHKYDDKSVSIILIFNYNKIPKDLDGFKESIREEFTKLFKGAGESVFTNTIDIYVDDSGNLRVRLYFSNAFDIEIAVGGVSEKNFVSSGSDPGTKFSQSTFFFSDKVKLYMEISPYKNLKKGVLNSIAAEDFEIELTEADRDMQIISLYSDKLIPLGFPIITEDINSWDNDMDNKILIQFPPDLLEKEGIENNLSNDLNEINQNLNEQEKVITDIPDHDIPLNFENIKSYIKDIDLSANTQNIYLTLTLDYSSPKRFSTISQIENDGRLCQIIIKDNYKHQSLIDWLCDNEAEITPEIDPLFDFCTSRIINREESIELYQLFCSKFAATYAMGYNNLPASQKNNERIKSIFQFYIGTAFNFWQECAIIYIRSEYWEELLELAETFPESSFDEPLNLFLGGFAKYNIYLKQSNSYYPDESLKSEAIRDISEYVNASEQESPPYLYYDQAKEFLRKLTGNALPIIYLEAPFTRSGDEIDWFSKTVTIKGKVIITGAELNNIKINDQTIQHERGFFNYSCSLREGINKISIVATNQYGQAAKFEGYINYTPVKSSATVNRTGAKIFESNNLNSQIINSNLPNGATLDVLEMSGDWYKVKFGLTVGWIHKSYLTESARGSMNIFNDEPHYNLITKNPTPLFRSPSSGSVVKQLRQNEKIVRISTEGDYYKVKSRSDIGYVFGGDVQIDVNIMVFDIDNYTHQHVSNPNLGRVLIVHYWDIACSACIKELPEVYKFLGSGFYKTWDKLGIDLEVVNISDSPETLGNFLNTIHARENKRYIEFMQQPIYVASNRYKTRHPHYSNSLPRTEIYGRNGNLIAVFYTAIEWNNLPDLLGVNPNIWRYSNVFEPPRGRPRSANIEEFVQTIAKIAVPEYQEEKYYITNNSVNVRSYPARVNQSLINKVTEGNEYRLIDDTGFRDVAGNSIYWLFWDETRKKQYGLQVIMLIN